MHHLNGPIKTVREHHKRPGELSEQGVCLLLMVTEGDRDKLQEQQEAANNPVQTEGTL